MQWQAELDWAVGAARDAGAKLRKWFHEDKTVLSAEGRDIKLQADRDAEEAILAVLSASAHPVLAEESGEHGMVDGGAPFWVVDPLDGTFNFSRGIPLCCVSIALCVGTEPVLGVIHDFNTGNLFSAVVGEGAWLDGEPMRVSAVEESGKGVLVTGLPTFRNFDDASMQGFLDEIRRFKKVRMLGSAALMLANVACGRADAYAEDDIMLWDVAAGAALVKAAGGYVDVRPSSSMKWARLVRCASHRSIWQTD